MMKETFTEAEILEIVKKVLDRHSDSETRESLLKAAKAKMISLSLCIGGYILIFNQNKAKASKKAVPEIDMEAAKALVIAELIKQLEPATLTTV